MEWGGERGHEGMGWGGERHILLIVSLHLPVTKCSYLSLQCMDMAVGGEGEVNR